MGTYSHFHTRNDTQTSKVILGQGHIASTKCKFCTVIVRLFFIMTEPGLGSRSVCSGEGSPEFPLDSDVDLRRTQAVCPKGVAVPSLRWEFVHPSNCAAKSSCTRPTFQTSSSPRSLTLA